MNTIEPQHCTIVSSSKPITEHPVKRFIRRAKQLVAPTHCRIRYDTMRNQWAVLTDNNSAHHHFTHGVMTNVVFSTAVTFNYDRLRCEGGGMIGIAEGDLRENYYGNDASDFNHMSFDKINGFIDAHSGAPIKSAQVLRLMSDRRALYK